MISLELIKRFQQISYYFNQQNFRQVVVCFKPPLSVFNVPAEIALMYAISQRRLGLLDASKSSFSDAITTYPHHAGLRNSFGNLLLEMGQTQLALEQFKQVIKLDPANSDGYLNSARALSYLGDIEKAVWFSYEAYAIKPDDLNVVIALAENLCQKADFAAAMLLYEGVLQKHPEHIKVLNNLGNLKRRTGEISEAIRLLEKASVQNNATVFRNLAACYVLVNNFTKAYHYYEQATKLAPDDVNAHSEYAALLWQRGDAAPFRHIERRLLENPTNFALTAEYIKMLLSLNAVEKAEHYLLPLLRQFPNDSTVLVLAAMVYRKKAEFAQSEVFSRQALINAKSTDVIAARSELGYTLLAQHKGAEALVVYQQLCLDDPFNQGWWTTLSSAFKQCGDLQQYGWLCNYSLVDVSVICSDSSNDLLPANFNSQLMPLLDKLHSNTRAPLGLSLQNGSQTFENIFDRNESPLMQLQGAILRQARIFIASLVSDNKHPFLSRLSENLKFQGSWSVQLRDEGFHKSHFHPMGWLSGVYYVDIPEAVELDGQGWLVFGRPDIPNVEDEGDFAIKPQPGMLVLFPSFMWHGTNPFRAKTNRVTIAFDLVPA